MQVGEEINLLVSAPSKDCWERGKGKRSPSGPKEEMAQASHAVTGLALQGRPGLSQGRGSIVLHNRMRGTELLGRPKEEAPENWISKEAGLTGVHHQVQLYDLSLNVELYRHFELKT
jgi:hypothetical protein